MGDPSKISKVKTLDEVQTLKAQSSSIILSNYVIQALRELSLDIPVKDTKNTFDELLIDMIKVYRKKRGLSDI